MIFSLLTSLALLAGVNGIDKKPSHLPARAQEVKTITTPGNVTIRYKEPGKEGVCETTPGVKHYSGYIDLDENSHTFFWFFEARHNPKEAPITLWLNGGPGSDSLIGLLQELGPCNVTANLTTQLNPYSWNEVSNLLFLSQPVGVGFSYSTEGEGSLDENGYFQNSSVREVQGRYPVVNASAIDTTDLAAVAAWHILQGFLGGLPQLDSTVKSREFNLWTESYGGHYGPAFFRHFSEQNELIANGSSNGTQLNFNSLGLINGIIDAYTQFPYYPEFAVNNTYGIKAINSTVYNSTKFALNSPGGCLDQLNQCRLTDRTTPSGKTICGNADYFCRLNVEAPTEELSGRGTYDIRHPRADPTPPRYYIDYLNLDHTRNALGVDLNYTSSNEEVFEAFTAAGDWMYPTFIQDLETLLNNGVRVSLIYGDADYICNWFGGEAVSLNVNFTHKAEFAAAGYAPFVVDGTRYGDVRQFGNFSFTRVYESGHEVPYYQPLASLELFRRTILNLDTAEGKFKVSKNYSTTGPRNSTHTEPFVPLPSVSGR